MTRILPSTRRTMPMALLRAREAMMAQVRPMLARHDITEQQWRVLRVLAELGSLEATALAEQASILPPSLTRIIKALQKRGFIKRSRVKGDGRRTLLEISPSGLALIDEMTLERITIYDGVRERFGEDRYEQLLDLLEALIETEQQER